MHYVLGGKIARAHPYQLDKTLSIDGAGAEAKATGEAIAKLRKDTETAISDAKSELTKETEKAITEAKEEVTKVAEDAITQATTKLADATTQAIAEVTNVANNGVTAAGNAQTAADNAKTAADNAQTTADGAKTAADNAQKDATKALGLDRIVMVKLWENEATDTEFEAVSGEDLYDSNPYDLYLAETQYSTESTMRKFEFMALGHTSRVAIHRNPASETGQVSILSRTFKINLDEEEGATTLTVGEATKKSLDGTLETDNTFVIPVAIYGIKGVV